MSMFFENNEVPTPPQKHERFCAWCDRRLNDKNEAEGPIVPKDQQKGTHGACKACYQKMIDEMD